MKRYFIVFLLSFLTVFAYSQNAYGSLNWGMNRNQVKEKYPQMEEEEEWGPSLIWYKNAHLAIANFVDYSIYRYIPDGKWYRALLKEEQVFLFFYFCDGKLQTVTIQYRGSYQDIISKYGQGKWIDFQGLYPVGNKAIIWYEKNKNRYIVFYDANLPLVSYINYNWILSIQKEIKQRSSVLD
jgi:hypothetical protein